MKPEPEALRVRTTAIDLPRARSLAALWASAPAGEKILWDPSEGGLHDAWTLMASGSASALVAQGPGALHTVQREAQSLLARVLEARDAGLDDLPAVALFGGAAFALGSAHDAGWEPFGDARFTLPRWVLGVRGDRAFLRVVEAETPGLSGLREDGNKIKEIQVLRPCVPRASGAGEMRSGGADEDLGEWTELVRRALSAIDSGSFEKLVTARCVTLCAGASVPMGRLLQALREADPERSTTVFAFETSGAFFVGSTPERLIEVRSGSLLADALAGSAPRDPEDFTQGTRLLASEKDRREHDHVVCAIRGALGDFVLPGGLSKSRAPEVKTLRHLLHLWTPVRAELRPGVSVLDLVSALHPTPAVAGVPRNKAVDWITREEPVGRGWYAGPVGWFDGRGEGSFMVALRSALIQGREARVYAGAGIVRGSVALAEYTETTAKMSSIRRAFEGAL